MQTAFIIGASRGIGLELVRQYRADGWRVIATARDDAGLERLRELGAQALLLDVADLNTVAGLGWQLDDEKIDVCIYNAGVSGPRTDGIVTPDEDAFDEVMHTNVLGALRVIPIVAPYVANAHGRFAFLSSRMGSIGAMAVNTAILYRASKAALNAVVKGASLEWGPKQVTMLALHPGWVRTDMGGANADLDVVESVSGMRRVIATAGSAQNGCFFDYSGANLPW